MNVDVNTAANTAYIAVENNGALKLVSSAGKAAVKLHNKYKNVDMSKITKDQFIRDVKDIGSAELIGIAADLYTLFGATSTPWARVEASLDLLVGTSMNNRTDIHNDLNYIKTRYNILQANRVAGSIFESRAVTALSNMKGWDIKDVSKTSKTVNVPGKGQITIIPDATFNGAARELVEVKNVKYLSNTDQFRAYVNSSEPLTLIVRYDTVISTPLLESFRGKNVEIYEVGLSAMSGGSSKLSLRSY